MSPLASFGFAAPWVLLALAALPALWWLLRVTPPAPRRQVFPAVRLLLGLGAQAPTAARTPPWLLALRLLAAALVVVGLARPVLDGAAALAGSGPLLLVLDDGWAAAADWPIRLRAADAVLARAERAGRRVALLGTATDAAAVAMPAADLRPRLAALRPNPWIPDRHAAAAAIRGWTAANPGGGSVFVGDGLADGDSWPEFAAALRATGPTRVLAGGAPLLLLPPTSSPDGLTVRVASATPIDTAVLAMSGDGRILARVPVTVAAGAAVGEALLRLPSELRNRLARLQLEGPQGALPSAGAVLLLDEGFRRRPVGIVRADAADTPLSGAAYYVNRALAPYSEVREGDLAALLAHPLSVLALLDQPLPPGPQSERLAGWVAAGGLLVRFAGPQLAEAAQDADAAAQPGMADRLLPTPLLAADRQLGGAMSWSRAERLAPPGPGSPFAGIVFPDEVQVHRQVLSDPAADLPGVTWARLSDGTPLVTQRAVGAGRIVLFHVTANADWSSLPLSGAFVAMLRRLVDLAAGVETAGTEAGNASLAPAETLDGEGVATPPPITATAIPAGAFAAAAVSMRHPPGLYGPEASRRALNLGAHPPSLAAAPAIPGAVVEQLGAELPERPLGPFLVALAVALLALDLLLSLRLRGLLQAAATLAALLAMTPARAEPAISPALATRLAYVVTGDAQIDDVARSGLAGLSAYVNARTAAVLAEPAAVVPGSDDLSFYPLLYWPLSADAPEPGVAMLAALNDYTAHGGIILIDTRDGGSGSGMAPGTAATLRRIGADGLTVPPLAPLTTAHVLARSFYLLRQFPGRYDGGAVWVGRDNDRSNDSVTPVIVGGFDWAAAWAVDADGRYPYATLPGGQGQRVLAYRFGVNLVMYALTGNYKGDQVHVPALLQRLGQ